MLHNSSLDPAGTAEANDLESNCCDNTVKVFQAVFNVTLNNEWDTTGDSLIDTLAVNNLRLTYF